MKKIVIFSILFLVFLGLIGGLIFLRQKGGPSTPKSSLIKIESVKPSETFIEYTDPTGFSFSYPDNLSIEKKENEEPNTYADLQIFSKDVNGSLSLKITDSKFKSLEDWSSASSGSATTSKEVPLGNLKALELKTEDRLLLGSLDQGILFNIDVPLVEEDFWLTVYKKILSSFTFTSPETTTSQETSGFSSDVTFEGEEVVE